MLKALQLKMGLLRRELGEGKGELSNSPNGKALFVAIDFLRAAMRPFVICGFKRAPRGT